MIDLFSGVGGFTLGFSDDSDAPEFKFRPRLMVDNDRAARDVATRNMPHVPFLDKDVSVLSADEVRKAAGLTAREEVHLLVGGPPCQGFSWLGARALDDTRNALVLEFLRFVKELKPLVALMENVPLIFTSHDGAIIQEIVESLSGMGYTSVADVLLASDYGVPQLRKRAMVVAYRADLSIVPRLPDRTHERFGYASDLMGDGPKVRFEPDRKPYISVEEAIGDLPSLEAGKGEDVTFYSSAPAGVYQEWARRGSIALFNHRSRSHKKEYLEKIGLIAEGGRNQELPEDQRFSDNYYSQAYARLHRNGIAQTITTYFANPGSGRFIHYRDLRSITVREAARLQSFPDRFIFDGTLTTQMRHVGNAVPPLMARALRNSIGEDLIAAGAHLEVRPVGRPKRPPPREDPRTRSRIMSAVPSKDSTAEILLRKALTALGIRGYRLHRRDLPGVPDVVFTRAKLAVFVDGCFWHGCPRCQRVSKSRTEYWEIKIERNQARDKKNGEKLDALGWTVLRIWEHELTNDAEECARRVESELQNLLVHAEG